MTLSRRLALSNNFGGVAVGGLIVGPTVQLASVPGTLTLAHGATGSALAGTPKDINDVATGARKYFHSSDVTIVTVDADTGVPTGVAAGSATITENFVPPVTVDEPVYSGSGGQSLAYADDMDGYTDLTTMGAFIAGGGPLRLVPAPSPAADGQPVDPAQQEIITGRLGTGSALRLKFSGVGAAPYYALSDSAEAGSPGAGDLVAHHATYWARMAIPDTSHGYPAIKWFMIWHRNPLGNTRIEWATISNGTWGFYDQSYAPTLAEMLQAQGPNIDGVNNTGWFRCAHSYKPHTPNAGTIAINHTTLAATFSVSQAGVISNGDTLSIQGIVPYTVSAFNGTTGCTLTKIPPDAGNAPLATDVAGLPFSSSVNQDGYVRMWVGGTKIMDFSRAMIGVARPAGGGVWCTAEVLACIATSCGVYQPFFGKNQTTVSDAWTYDIDDFHWWTGAAT